LQPEARLLKKALIFSAFFVLFSPSVFADACPPLRIDESSRVKYVYDGDTLQLKDGRKVRLIGIDTPEIFSKRQAIARDIKASGERARAALQKQLGLANQRIGLAYGAQRFDRYGRTLAHVFLPSGKNLQAWLIAQGYAIAFTTPPNDRMSHCYQQQEARARQLTLGIWKLPRYQVKHSGQLNETSQGFYRLQGKVSRIWQSKNKLTILLDNIVDIKIYKNDLPNFNKHMLNNLQGKKIRVRGWLRQKKMSASQQKTNQNKNRYFMSLRHPDALKVIH